MHALAIATISGEKDGKKVDDRYTHVVHISNGKLTESWIFDGNHGKVDEFWGWTEWTRPAAWPAGSICGTYRDATSASSFQAVRSAEMFSLPSTRRESVARYTVVRLMPASAR